MLRSNISAVMSRNRFMKMTDCKFSSMKFKKPTKRKKSGGYSTKRTPAMSEIINLTDKKSKVAINDVDTFLSSYPLTSLSGVEISALVRSLGKTKYPYEPSQIGQIASALGTFKLNAKCLGTYFQFFTANQSSNMHLLIVMYR